MIEIATPQMQWMRMNLLRHIVLGMCFLVTWYGIHPVFGQRQLPDKPADEAQLVLTSCKVCHGTQEMQRGPILDGLPAWYVTHQLEKFSKGIRGKNEENKSEILMAPVVQQYSDTNTWHEVAQLIEAQSPPRHFKAIRGDAQKGKVLFAVCSSCHGPKGEGNASLKAPPLNVQEDWYLMDQLRKFQMGLRGYDARDLEGKLMQGMARMFTVPHLKDIVAYLATLRDGKRKPGVVPGTGSSHLKPPQKVEDESGKAQ